MILNVIGMALFIGIYAYALSIEPPGLGDDAPTGRWRRLALARWTQLAPQTSMAIPERRPSLIGR